MKSPIDIDSEKYEIGTRSGLRHRGGEKKIQFDISTKEFFKTPDAKQQKSAAAAAATPSNLFTPSAKLYSPNGKEELDYYFSFEDFSLWRYLEIELLGIGTSEDKQYDAAVSKIRNFVYVPYILEKLLLLGFFICFDVFLYGLAYLPIRVVSAVLLLLYELLARTMQFLLSYSPFSENGNKFYIPVGQFFHRTHAYDLIRGLLTVTGCLLLHCINMSRIYHYIRGQTTIKLYVLTGMLEVLDRLFGSFGRDVFDSLFTQTRNEPTVRKLFLPVLIAAAYVAAHSGIYFVHVATLTVAMNSSDQALISVFILNNFAEFKSFVFKKYDGNNLFQLSCADITERFKLILFLFLITGVSVSQAGFVSVGEILSAHAYVGVLMLMGEMAADWTKHAFIAKFNSLEWSEYEGMAKILRRDIVKSQSEAVVLDHTHIVARRIGISQIPLVCVAVRYVELALQSIECQRIFAAMTNWQLIGLLLGVFTVLLVLKTVTGISLLVYSAWLHNRDRALKEAAFSEKEQAEASERKDVDTYSDGLSRLAESENAVKNTTKKIDETE